MREFASALLTTTLVLAFAPSTFAQVDVQAFGVPSVIEVSTNRTAQTADPSFPGAGIVVAGSAIATATLAATSLFIDYPAVITSSGRCTK
jgi:hypothetical protein